jgi:hypothetical protein
VGPFGAALQTNLGFGWLLILADKRSTSLYELYSSQIIHLSIPTTLDLMEQLKSSSKPETEDKQFYLAKSTAFSSLQLALNVFKELANKTMVPGLQEGVKALVIVLDVMQARTGSCSLRSG